MQPVLFVTVLLCLLLAFTFADQNDGKCKSLSEQCRQGTLKTELFTDKELLECRSASTEINSCLDVNGCKNGGYICKFWKEYKKWVIAAIVIVFIAAIWFPKSSKDGKKKLSTEQSVDDAASTDIVSSAATEIASPKANPTPSKKLAKNASPAKKRGVSPSKNKKKAE